MESIITRGTHILSDITNRNHQLPPKNGTIEQLVTISEDIEKVIAGEKTATRRNDRYADIGEVMSLNNHKFVVHNVYTQSLGEMTEADAQKEGYQTLDAYKEKILSIHPGMRWVPSMRVWVHEYKRQN